MSEEQIKYQKHYIPLTRDELIERLHLALRPKRFNHVPVSYTHLTLPTTPYV